MQCVFVGVNSMVVVVEVVTVMVVKGIEVVTVMVE